MRRFYVFIIDQLKNDSRVVQQSLEIKVALINQTSGEQKKDIEAELRAGYHFLHLKNMTKLAFTEAPDIVLTMRDNTQHGIEVKRIRPKPEDEKNEQKFQKNNSNSLVRYGKPRDEFNPWESHVEKAIDEKNGKRYSTSLISLFLISDSPYQIEKREIVRGIDNVLCALKNQLKFCTIFFDTHWKNNNEIYYKYINRNKMNLILANEIDGNDYYEMC